MKKLLLNLLSGIALVVFGTMAVVRAALGLVVGIVLTWLTGISWVIIVPICMVVAVLTLFGDEDGNGDTTSRRRKRTGPR
ncbi:hypothetical protein AB1K70_13450 [Bremerella sp. JC770]|uniref:hypothetical protein n=1 Tax=Bremerella sp. JC770 TaxID=3232137 RepID=UPI003459F604